MLGSKLPLDMANADENWGYLEVGISGGASRLITCRSAAPIRILNPHVRASSCHVLVSNYGGGLVDGDRVRMKVICRNGARLHIGSVGNLQVYKSPIKGSAQTIKGVLEENTLCVLNADPVVLHSGSQFEQKQEWNVHPESSLLVAEWVLAGRLETGERFAFRKYVSEFTAFVDGNPLVDDRFEFQPDHLDYRDPALFSGLACLLKVYMVGHQWAPLESLLSKEIDRYRKSDSQTMASIHPVQRHGYILRALANNRGSLTWITDRIYEFMSQEEYLGFNPAERKY
jgi:urease accessory protein